MARLSPRVIIYNLFVGEHVSRLYVPMRDSLTPCVGGQLYSAKEDSVWLNIALGGHNVLI